MLPIRIGLASRSGAVDFPSLVRVANALNTQIARDLMPIWSVSGTVSAQEDPDRLEPGIWPVFIVDQLDPGMGGFHQTEHNQPFAMVLAGDTWSLSASHEVLEMLVDPSGNRLVAAPAVAIRDNDVADAAGKFEYLLEVCDPSEDSSCAYLIDGVLVSDFYSPNYFDPTGSTGARYSFSGRITRPRQVLKNGYLSWFNPTNRKLQQIRHFGAPEIIDLGTVTPGGSFSTGGRSLRGFVDSRTIPPHALSDLHEAVPSVAAREARLAFLAAAAPQRAGLYARAFADFATVHQEKAAKPTPNAADLQRAIADNRAAFGKPGVLSVRTGWRFTSRLSTDALGAGHGLTAALGRSVTSERAIIVTALPDKLDALKADLATALPDLPHEVRPAGVMQQMRAEDPGRYIALATARHELRQPEFPGEIFFDGNGKEMPLQAPLAVFAASHAQKEELPYQAPVGIALDEVGEDIAMILHVSPDAGWTQLSDFLAGTRKKLVVGMYDFTSAHILAAVEEAMGGNKALTLTLDHPATNPSRDQTDEETRADLAEKLSTHFMSAWALTNSDRMATAWIYPNAYHIKVAVRDEDTFWLSSGNWNNSNQPEINLEDPAAARKIAADHDRDWHVIVTNKKLADCFRAFLQNDYEIASKHNVPAGDMAAATAAMANIEVPAEFLAAGRSPRKFFQPHTVSGNFRVQPLLTPDNYKEHVGPLIKSARKRFYMQTQYIHPSGKEGDEDHDALIAAVKALADGGVDVRLITSEYQTDDWVERVLDQGIPATALRRQAKVHNKGIVVDSSIAMVSSQNWSADGTLRNRDAGLIIHNPEAAAYFEEIFLHDWNNLASPVSG